MIFLVRSPANSKPKYNTRIASKQAVFSNLLFLRSLRVNKLDIKRVKIKCKTRTQQIINYTKALNSYPAPNFHFNL